MPKTTRQDAPSLRGRRTSFEQDVASTYLTRVFIVLVETTWSGVMIDGHAYGEPRLTMRFDGKPCVCGVTA